MIAGRAANNTDDGAAPSRYTGARNGRQAENGTMINRFGAVPGRGLAGDAERAEVGARSLADSTGRVLEESENPSSCPSPSSTSS
jgi:hypothetical protein